MKKVVIITKAYEVTIPDENIEKHLKDYRKAINDSDDEDFLYEHIAWNVAQGFTFIEGVGRVCEEGIDTSGVKEEYKATDINVHEISSGCEVEL